jgi:hypothetical protein
VASLGAKVGGTASGSLVTLSMGRPGIKGQLNPADARLVRLVSPSRSPTR